MNAATPGGRPGRPRPGSTYLAVFVLAVLAIAAGCASPPAPPPALPVAEGPFAFRDPRVGLPASDRARIGPEAETSLAAAMEVLAADRPQGWDSAADSSASGAISAGRKKSGTARPFDLAGGYLNLRRGDRASARTTLGALASASAEPGYAPAVEALADLDASEGRFREALAGYRRLSRLLPTDPRAKARIAATREALRASLREEASRALAAPDLEAARRAALGLLELDPSSPDGSLVLARAALAGGRREDAWTAASRALELDPRGKETNLLVADVASRTGRYAEAVAAYERLAATDPSFASRAAEARAEDRIQNLPDGARRAALSPKLTRAQLAVLLWWSVPEVRLAPASAPPDVATDVVDHPERTALVRAIALGFLQVSRETHRVGTDVPVSRVEFASDLRRAAVVASGGKVPSCLAQDPPAVASLATCGILPESGSRTVTGREALAALDRVARLAREGGSR